MTDDLYARREQIQRAISQVDAWLRTATDFAALRRESIQYTCAALGHQDDPTKREVWIGNCLHRLEHTQCVWCGAEMPVPPKEEAR